MKRGLGRDADRSADGQQSHWSPLQRRDPAVQRGQRATTHPVLDSVGSVAVGRGGGLGSGEHGVGAGGAAGGADVG